PTLARQIMPIRKTSRRSRIPHLRGDCLTNLNLAIFSRNGLSFRVPEYQPDQIPPRLYVKTRPERDARGKFVFQSVIFPMHSDGLLHRLKKIPVPIKQSGHTR